MALRKKTAADTKNVIIYSRDYRRFPRPDIFGVLFAVFAAAPVILLLLFFYDELTLAVCNWAGNILSGLLDSEVLFTSSDYLPGFGPLYFLDLAGRTPGYTYSLISAIVTLVTIIVASQTGWDVRALMIYLCMGLYIHFISSLFFLFFPEYFPYTLTQYSELYMKQQISIWIMITAVGGIALGLMPDNGLPKLVTFIVIEGIAFLYGVIRYVIYLYILAVATSLWMASLFFTFGVLFDFLQMISIYVVYVKRLSDSVHKREGGVTRWKWS